jgi:hypothetical protein
MATGSDQLRGAFDAEETGSLTGLLAEEEEIDRGTAWRLGTWAVASVGAVVLALVTNQSSIGLRREQSASSDLIKQAQQLQLAVRESQNETRRLVSAVDTLNGDRDRLYSRVAVLEQGLDSVTGAIVRQAPAPPPQASATAPAGTKQASAIVAAAADPSVPSKESVPPPVQAQAPAALTAPAGVAPTALSSNAVSSNPPTSTAPADPLPKAAKSSPATPAVTPLAATAPAVTDKAALEKQEKQASAAAPPSEPSPAVKSANAPPSSSLTHPKSMPAPAAHAAAKLTEPSTPPKTVTSAPLPEIASAAAGEKPEEADGDPAAPELVARRTEFGVDVGGANSIPGLRALWRGLLKVRSNTALTTLRPIIMIRENNNGLGMQLRLVAGPINDAAAAAKICASLNMSDRSCTTTVFEGQRLTLNTDEQPWAETRAGSESKPASEAQSGPDAKLTSNPKLPGRHRNLPKHVASEEEPPKPEPPKPEPPKPEPSTLSRLFGSH